MANRKRCSGHRKSGYWKGSPCGATPTHTDVRRKHWCRNHLPVGCTAMAINTSKPLTIEVNRHGG